MMPYDYIDGSTDMAVLNGLETKEIMHSYSSYASQDSFLKPTLSNSNPMVSSDLWSTASSSNSNPSNASFYFPSSSSFDFNMPTHPSQYTSIDNSNYDYQPLPDVSSSSSSSSYLTDPYSQMFANTYSLDPYATTTSYNATAVDYSSTDYLSNTDTYQHLHPMYATGNVAVPPAGIYLSSTSMDMHADYQSTISQWDSAMIKMRTHDVTSASNSSNSRTSASKQPCLVCHEESSGYHFGAYTCESCKAFYRRVTKDPRIQIKHSCEVPLPNITKSNRKDCRACRKAKCDRVGMTAMPKDRPSRTAASKAACKSSSLIVTDLLEQLARDLTYDHPLTSSSALESLLRLIDLPSFNPLTIDSHSVYMNAVRIWSNQYNHALPPMSNVALTDIFAVLLFLFHIMMSTSDYEEDKSSNNSKFDKLVSILQQEIQRLTGTDQRSACRIKALFMKSYVALAQYPNSTNLLENNNLAQAPFLPYQQYPLYGQ